MIWLEKNNENNIDDYSVWRCLENLSQYKQAAISYIAGYVGKKVKESTCCTECGMALGSVSAEASSSFLVLKVMVTFSNQHKVSSKYAKKLKDAFNVCWL